MKITQIIFYLITTTFLIICAASGAFFFALSNHVVDFSSLWHDAINKPSILLDDQGNEWARFALDKRTPVSYEQLPQHLINAFVAAEDWQFFNHAGISFKSIMRSIWVNVRYGKRVQGASTITHQLVKLLFLDSQKTMMRKVKEQLYVFLVEYQFSKEQILQTYLNHVYFGCGIYGVQAACQRFWGIDVSEINLEQAALLAGIVKSPANYCPLLYPLSAKQRRNIILNSMRKLSMITGAEYEQAKEKEIEIKQTKDEQCAPHLREFLRQELEDLIGKQALYTQGFIIQTTLNKQMQQQAKMSFKTHVARLRSKMGMPLDGALMTIEGATGAIKAVVGGFDFASSKFNRAFKARRQMGSIFKPVLYTAAIQQGLNFAMTQLDEPLTLTLHNKQWTPHNYNHQFEGCMTLAYALSHSNNIVAVKTLLHIGYAPIIMLAKKCHIKGPFNPYPSLALGCVDATVQEVAGMFNIFAHNGVYVMPHTITWIKDQWGTKIYKHAIKNERIVPAYISDQVTKVLSLSVERLFAHDASFLQKTAMIRKTGTTNEFRTCWFAGATPDFTTVIYIGNDDNSSPGHSFYPAKTVFPIWRSLHAQLPINTPSFNYDPHLTEVTINQWSGQASNKQYDAQAISILV